jgi:hypothetical protein
MNYSLRALLLLLLCLVLAIPQRQAAVEKPSMLETNAAEQLPHERASRPIVCVGPKLAHDQAALSELLDSPRTDKTAAARGAKLAGTATLLHERFTELLRDERNRQRPLEYVQMLQESETAAQRLEMFLAQDADLHVAANRDEAKQLLGEVSSRCVICHQTYRDTAGSR